VSWESAQVCPDANRRRYRPWSDHARRSSRGRQLRLIAGIPPRRLGFEAGLIEGYDQPSRTFFVAYSHRRSAGLEVNDSAAVYPLSAPGFHLADPSRPAKEAVVRPSAPFSGSATFQLESPSSASWEGDLAVELPGLGEVRLTGPHLYSGLCDGSTCTKTLPPGIVSGAGS
jgi:hypothetical protein